ncbi:hypothetical protein OPT61_g4536 [Boeremia exigua]|uniref:Uncharacterized protein n=1 Tax=Boeremia exigua TaxID=749465 RepID=A0ACC2IDX2_9PLEO|nr:hypothetical protein OPT61_g4536 [Boeremia exigua]
MHKRPWSRVLHQEHLREQAHAFVERHKAAHRPGARPTTASRATTGSTTKKTQASGDDARVHDPDHGVAEVYLPIPEHASSYTTVSADRLGLTPPPGREQPRLSCSRGGDSGHDDHHDRHHDGGDGRQQGHDLARTSGHDPVVAPSPAARREHLRHRGQNRKLGSEEAPLDKGEAAHHASLPDGRKQPDGTNTARSAVMSLNSAFDKPILGVGTAKPDLNSRPAMNSDITIKISVRFAMIGPVFETSAPVMPGAIHDLPIHVYLAQRAVGREVEHGNVCLQGRKQEELYDYAADEDAWCGTGAGVANDYKFNMESHSLRHINDKLSWLRPMTAAMFCSRERIRGCSPLCNHKPGLGHNREPVRQPGFATTHTREGLLRSKAEHQLSVELAHAQGSSLSTWRWH